MKPEENKEIMTEEDEEFELAKAEAAQDNSTSYVHTFRKPFLWMGKEYKTMSFDFESLTGEDSMNIEAELQAKGIAVLVPSFSGAYLTAMAARACAEKVGSDAFKAMPLRDYVTIRTKARNFLMESEQ